jgi:perosamine synthetase
MKPRILYTKPSITELEVQYATDAAANGWGDHCYDYIHRFERAFGEHLGVRHCIATSSCTGDLHLGLLALGVGPGDEVILADTNWIATVAPVVHCGATPVFVDILPDSWCIDPALIEPAITARTKAIIATHLYGNLGLMDQLLDLGKRHGLPVIEDAAEALGSEWKGQRAGSLGAFACFSFHGSKTITTGEGGMFVTDDPNLHETALTLSNHGRRKGETRQFWPERVGIKYKMSNLQAALGCAQIERAPELIARKRSIMNMYRDRLASIQGLRMNPEPAGTRNGFWMPTVVFDADTGITRERLRDAFAAENIDARVFFHPLSSLPMFRGTHPPTRHAWDIPQRAMNLPSYHDMQTEDIERVSAVLHAVSGRGR